ncbi:hydroxyisourate hydrolase [Modestobacter sp. KNN46-3]|jgi:5-hydroxyisourate hydrolase|uniref:hydroxyisourate hydrolase n=1 Tax=Modestobacter sp. KNN46-3 TaxID=2711218 RepID=UPI0013DF5561|nr:hydroxyisourate hydrolase [Modestobacter sp. KNN46-3]
MSAVTTHVLDTAQGRPAAGVLVRLEQVTGVGSAVIAAGTTDDDGRVRSLGPDRVCPGSYRLVFDTAGYFTRTGQPCFFPEVSVSFVVADPTQHHHVPLLLSPFAYSTYRGS